MTKAVMLLFNQYSPDPRVRQEALSLSSKGYEITIIAWDRNGTAKEVKEDFAKIVHLGPQLPPGFGNMRVALQAIIKYRAMRKFSREAAKLVRSIKPDIIHSHDLDTLHIGVRCSRKLGVPVIYDSHEIYPQMMAKDIKFGIKFISAMERRLVRRVNGIITVTGYHERYFKEMGAENIAVVTNCKNIVAGEYTPPSNEKFTLLYIGGFNNSRFLHEAIDVCGKLDDMIFKIGGGGLISDELERAAKAAPNKNVEFLGWVPYDRVIPRTGEADAVLCMLDPANYNNRVGPPNKIFEAMVAGRPIIATKGTYSGQVVEEEGIGIAVEFSKDAFRKAVLRLRDDPHLRERLGRKALDTAIRKYNWALEEKKLIAAYGRLLAK